MSKVVRLRQTDNLICLYDRVSEVEVDGVGTYRSARLWPGRVGVMSVRRQKLLKMRARPTPTATPTFVDLHGAGLTILK